MQNSIHPFWRNWLSLVIVGTIGFGLALMVLPDVMQTFFNLLFYGTADASGRFDESALQYIQFMTGVLGAVMVGWGTSLWVPLHGAFKRGEREGWNTITASIIIWYVIDSAFSIYSGFVPNVILNTVFFILFMIPLGATYRQFHPR